MLLRKFPDLAVADAELRTTACGQTGHIAAVQRDGTCWLSGTTWAGRAAMRVSVSGWRTTADDIERSADAILACLAAVDDGTRSAVTPGTGSG